MKFEEFLNESRYWTPERLQDEANKYKTRKEFKDGNIRAWSAANKHGLMNDIFDKHEKQGRILYPKGYWTPKRIQDEANKYKTRKEFSEKSSPAYDAACKQKLLDVVFDKHYKKGILKPQVPAGYWTPERIQDEANKYKTRGELEINKSGAYKKALKLGIMNDIFSGHTNGGYADKEEWKENSYAIYVYELPDHNRAYVGLTNNLKRRDKEHLFDIKEGLNSFCVENNIPLPKYKVLEENLNDQEARRQEEYWEKYYKDDGWLMLNIAKTGSLGGGSMKWTKKALQIKADKYKTRNEFATKDWPAYQAASRKGIIDDLFSKHDNLGRSYNKKENGYWTIKRLQEIVKKYKYKGEFSKNGPAYQAAREKGIVDDLFKNHENGGEKHQKWTPETLQKFANKYNVHVHLVAHPKKVDGKLNNDSVSGKGELTNLVDNVYTVERVEDERFDTVIEVTKNRWEGAIGTQLGLGFCKTSKRLYHISQGDNKRYGWERETDPDWLQKVMENEEE